MTDFAALPLAADSCITNPSEFACIGGCGTLLDWNVAVVCDTCLANHPATDICPDPECGICAVRDCPYSEMLHYHHDGCPACYGQGMEDLDAKSVSSLYRACEQANRTFHESKDKDLFTDEWHDLGTAVSDSIRYLTGNPDGWPYF